MTPGSAASSCASALAVSPSSSPLRSGRASQRSGSTASSSGRSVVCSAAGRCAVPPAAVWGRAEPQLSALRRGSCPEAAAPHVFPAAQTVEGGSSELTVVQLVQHILLGHVAALAEVWHSAKVSVWNNFVGPLARVTRVQMYMLWRTVVTARRAVVLVVAGVVAGLQVPVLDMALTEELQQSQNLIQNLFNENLTHEEKLALIQSCSSAVPLCQERMKEVAEHTGLTAAAIEQLHQLATARGLTQIETEAIIYRIIASDLPAEQALHQAFAKMFMGVPSGGFRASP